MPGPRGAGRCVCARTLIQFTTVCASCALSSPRRALAIVLAVCLLLPMLTGTVAGAQSVPDTGPTLEDIELRDTLVAN